MAAKTPTAVIFDSLRGSWRLRRSLKSQLPHFPSGIFEGVATFRSRKPSANNAASELLYTEHGELRTDNGFTLKANRKYVYRYDADEDKITAWFVTEDSKQLDGKEEVDYLFHDLETEHQRLGWTGKGEHLCELDMCEWDAIVPVPRRAGWLIRNRLRLGVGVAVRTALAPTEPLNRYYEFRLPRVMEEDQTMDVFGVKYKVQGPQKDYTSDTAYERTFSADLATR
ncbi:hypothetical protein LTR53_015089 [Teratosphaeriaceae sp. CCFEE 6253]|nr:hypothetical protein LTR53_015089 [Teratosphaeriaceae sp. CCFEE 6253]